MSHQLPARVYAFDVNETLLDLGSLDQHFQRVFGSAGIRRQWFQQVLQSALVSTVVQQYADFTQIQHASLEMVGRRLGVAVSASDREAIVGGMKTLSPHPDVRDALQRLHDAGVRLFTLTNSPPDVAQAQIENAGLRGYFEQLLSADTVRRLKPAPEPYRMAAERAGVSIDHVCLAAAHAWDVTGAMHAGASAAFVARPGAVLDPLFPRPKILGKDLLEVAETILSIEAGTG